MTRKTLPADFWDRILVGDGCWEWQAYRHRQGYGMFYIDGKYHLAHRWMYKEWYGVDPGDLDVLHACDNPCCCNPTHLSLGTHQENMRQMMDRNRGVQHKGEACGKSKLTEKEVLEIRASSLSHRVLAAEYGVSHNNIGQIRRRKTWTHI